MRSKLRTRFRIGALCLIALFLLIPLMSSPVAAAFTDPSTVTTNNPAVGVPTVIITPVTNRIYVHTGVATATFTLVYSFTDSKPAGAGSRHYADITVTPPGAPVGFASVGPMHVNAGTGPFTGTLTIGPLNYAVPPPSTTWTIVVNGWCRDLQTGTITSVTQTTTVTVV